MTLAKRMAVSRPCYIDEKLIDLFKFTYLVSAFEMITASRSTQTGDSLPGEFRSSLSIIEAMWLHMIAASVMFKHTQNVPQWLCQVDRKPFGSFIKFPHSCDVIIFAVECSAQSTVARQNCFFSSCCSHPSC
mmetsp:Transcript_11749/g.18085  ORF Transcript_11749/g.18085 Transcript_11749/m.18085 type:complete len:132 (-) Transcript_11749:94-489(-)